jgi:hypothetical protein
MKLKDYCLSSGVDLFSSFKALIMYNDSKIILLDYKKDLPTNGVKNLVCIDNQYENIIWIADLPTKLYDIYMRVELKDQILLAWSSNSYVSKIDPKTGRILESKMVW